MITAIVQSAVRDLIGIASDESFFDETEAARGSRATRQLGKAYPESLCSYLSSVSAKQFAEDIESLLPILSGGSVMAMGREAAKHRLIKACAEAVQESWISGSAEAGTYYGDYFTEVLAERGDAQRARILERELQEFLELALGKDSPIIQLADNLDTDAYKKFHELYGGIPSFSIRRQLLGGSRLFVKGKLVDNSWRAKVQTFLSALR